MLIKGSVVVITGSAQGIGRAVAEHLLTEGAKVCLSDMLTQAGEQARKELSGKFGENIVTFIRCNVTSLEDLTALYDGAEQYFGEPVSIFCNNAGINHTAGWRKCLDVNIVGVMQGTYLAMERMSKEHGGQGGLIINTGSAAGIIFGDQDPALVEANSYIVAKHGVIALTRSLGNKINFAKTGVMVQCVCPNFVDTNLIRFCFGADLVRLRAGQNARFLAPAPCLTGHHSHRRWHHFVNRISSADLVAAARSKCENHQMKKA